MWIIEDMFKSRKGIELKNSLTEYIPDTYFEYGEWDKFLFERDNLRLIKAAEESQEIYMKNREEYRRCFQLIDAVNINMFEKRKHIQVYYNKKIFRIVAYWGIPNFARTINFLNSCIKYSI